MLVAVYGTLRKDLGNYQRFLTDCEFMGTFETPPMYSLYTLGGFPGLKKDGNTSIVMDVFKVDQKKLDELDHLEGYELSRKKEENFYVREPFETPFGTAFTYFYYRSVLDSNFIKSGDWKEFQNTKKLESYV